MLKAESAVYVPIYTVLDLSGDWGFNPPPPLVPLTPKFVLTPEKIVKISQKYIADPPPLWFSHKSSTVHIIFGLFGRTVTYRMIDLYMLLKAKKLEFKKENL